MNLLGIAVPFVVSLVCSFVDLSLLFLPWLLLLLGAVSAALLRSWWALLIVPIALTAGTLPSLIVRSHGLPNMSAPGFLAGATLFALLALIPLTVGAAIGVPLGRELPRLHLGAPR